MQPTALRLAMNEETRPLPQQWKRAGIVVGCSHTTQFKHSEATLEDTHRDLSGSGQQAFDLAIELDQGQRAAGHIQRCAVFANIVAAHADAARGQLLMRATV